MAGILITDFVITLFIFLRILSAFIAAPLFGGRSIPVQLKILLSALIAYIVFLANDFSSVEINFSIWFLFFMAIKEILTGLVIGFMLHFIFYAIQFAGHFMGFSMGLSMAQAMSPMNEVSSTVIGQVLFYGALLVFVVIDGHHYLINALSLSFEVIPLGQYTINDSVYNLLIIHSVQVFVLAVKIASPILVSFFLVNIAEGVTARMMPQMQVFFVTQPLKLGLGFVLLSAGVPLYIGLVRYLLENYEYSLMELVKAMS